MGWTDTMINNIPHFVPPRWLGREQTPKRNTVHDTGVDLPDP